MKVLGDWFSVNLPLGLNFNLYMLWTLMLMLFLLMRFPFPWSQRKHWIATRYFVLRLIPWEVDCRYMSLTICVIRVNNYQRVGSLFWRIFANNTRQIFATNLCFWHSMCLFLFFFLYQALYNKYCSLVEVWLAF